MGAEEAEMGWVVQGWCKSEEEEEEGQVECTEKRGEKNSQKDLRVLSRPPCSVVFDALHE